MGNRGAAGHALAEANGRARVVIVDDHKLVAEAIESILVQAGLDVAAVTPNGDEARVVVLRTRPDLVLVDLSRLGLHGIEWSKRVMTELPETKVVALTGTGSRMLADAAIRAGIHGCLTKDTPMPQFIAALRSVLDGNVVVPYRQTSAFRERTPEQRQAEFLAEQLTGRERDVLGLLVEGASSQQMARRLGVSRNTIRTHIQNILTKLQVHSRLEAAAFAVRHGILELD